MAFSQLCDDMKPEIFSRTSLQTLVSMYDWHFYANDSHGLNMVDDDLNFLPFNFRILAERGGIMVFESPDPRTHGLFRFYVCHPSTQQVLELPNPKTKYLTQRVAVVMVGSKAVHYKIVRLSLPRNFGWIKRDKVYNAYHCEIFDSATWAWKQLDVVKLPLGVFLTGTQPIITRSSVYMLLTNNEILEVDVYSENWRIFSCPIPTLKYAGYYTFRHLVKCEGKLGFVCKPADGCWEIWVCKNDEKTWEKKYVFNEE